MQADVTLLDLGMAALVIFGIAAAISVVAVLVGYLMMRHDDVVGPLASAKREHEIEEHRSSKILQAKNLEVKLALADAEIIKAQASVIRARGEANAAMQKELEVGP